MIILTSTDTLEIKLGAARATLDNPVVICWEDLDDTTWALVGAGRELNTTNGTTVVTICPAPSSGHRRFIKKISMPVKDTASIAVTLQIFNSSARFELLIGTVLAVGDSLQDDGE